LKIAVVVGTRPEIIKMAPIIRELKEKMADYFIIHTGQHYSYYMDKVFFEQLDLPQADVTLEVGSGTHAQQTAKILTGMEAILQQQSPDIVLVEGDTNSVLAAALAASKLHIQVGHVEAGLRSMDKSMPEEINRIVADHCADLLFAPTDISKQNLISENIKEENIFVTGNTIVDALYQNMEMAKKGADVFRKLRLVPRCYFLVTIHRQENVDDRERFASIIEGLVNLSEREKTPVIYPVHPRAKKMIDEFKLDTGDIKIIEPVDYFSFIYLESNARLILTDSGGVQEEACILQVPCVTLRDNTERPETLSIGANVLAGACHESIVKYAYNMLNKKTDWPNPYGDGRAAEKIVSICLRS